MTFNSVSVLLGCVAVPCRSCIRQDGYVVSWVVFDERVGVYPCCFSVR